MAEHTEAHDAEPTDAEIGEELDRLTWSIDQICDAVSPDTIAFVLAQKLGELLAETCCDEHRKDMRRHVIKMIDDATKAMLRAEAEAEREEAGAVH